MCQSSTKVGCAVLFLLPSGYTWQTIITSLTTAVLWSCKLEAIFYSQYAVLTLTLVSVFFFFNNVLVFLVLLLET